MFGKLAGIGLLIAVVAVAALAIMKVSNKETPVQFDEDVAVSVVRSETEDFEKSADQKSKGEQTGIGTAAIERAAKDKKYLFVYFYRDENEQTQRMRAVFDKATKKLSGKAESVVINVADSTENAIVEKFGVGRPPWPLALVLAPNGAITGGFPGEFDENRLVESFATPCMERSLKALQERKLVFICVQNSSTKNNKAAMTGVRDFKADRRFSQATEIITLDPRDESESKFLKKLAVDQKLTDATTVLLAPPGVPIARVAGATDKKKLVSAVLAVGSGCGPKGCGPKGCGPKK